MSQEWYYTLGGKRVGPVSQEQLQQMAATGQLGPGEKVWRTDFPGWVPARSVPGLFDPPPGAAAPDSATWPDMPILEETREHPVAGRRRKRKKERPESLMTVGLRITLIIAASMAVVVVLIVLINRVFIPLLDLANFSTFSGTSRVDLDRGATHSFSTPFKRGQMVSISVKNQTGAGAIELIVTDSANHVLRAAGEPNPSLRFEAQETGSYTIEVRNAGREGCYVIITWKGV